MPICPLCTSDNVYTLFQLENREYLHCVCGFEFSQNAVDKTSETPELYDKSYYSHWEIDKNVDSAAEIGKRATFTPWLNKIERFISPPGKVLDIGCATGLFCLIAREHSWQTSGLELSRYTADIAKQRLGDSIFHGDLNSAPYLPGEFSLITSFDVLEHIGSPVNFIAKVNTLLSNNGILALSTPNVHSLSRKILGKKWFQFKPEHCSYFSPDTIRTLLSKHKFEIIYIKQAQKKLSLSYLRSYINAYLSTSHLTILSTCISLLPENMQHTPITIPTGEMLVIARKME